MNKVNIGIIGAGRIGLLHAQNILKSDLYHLKAITDIKIDHLENTQFDKVVPVITTDAHLIFNDPEIDAVMICSSTDTHADYIKRAAVAGKHIFCEKPISFVLEETIESLQLVKEHGVKFQSGFNRRFDKHFQKVQKSVQANQIGKPHIIKVSSRDPQVPPEDYVKVSGGMFMDMTIHDFDMVRFLAGSEVVDITVQAANLIDPMFQKYNDVDSAIITLSLESGALAVIDNSRQAVYGYDQRIEVFGDKGVVSAQNERETNIKIETKEATKLDNPKHFFLDRYKDAYVEEINAFAESILYDSPLQCTGNDGYKAELLALAARISHEEKRTVRMEELEKITQ